MTHFLYQLKLIPRLKDEKAWTKEDEAIVRMHFMHLKALTEAGTVLLAGKTDREMLDGFGIVIFVAQDFHEAQALMASDPAISNDIMTGTIFNYQIALKGDF